MPFARRQEEKQLSAAPLAELEKIPRFAPAVEPLAERVTTLMDAIRALGHLPRWKQAQRDNGRTRASSDLEDEYALAGRLREAKRDRRLSEAQLAELAELRGGPMHTWEERMQTLMAEIRALGHLPRATRGLGDEFNLAHRLQYARKEGRLSQAELAELEAIPRYAAVPPVAERMARVAERMNTLMADIRALGHLPRITRSLGDESRLARRLREATRQGQLSEAQLAELAEIPRYAPPAVPWAERMNTLMADIRAFGRLPRFTDGNMAEYSQAQRFARGEAPGSPQ